MIRTISSRPVGASTVGAVEHYRALADRLRLTQSSSAVQTIGLTSCSPREGVSTVAANLAITAAAMFDRPVLLVDANFLRPALRRMFRLRQGPGLADVLLSAATLVGWLAGRRAAGIAPALALRAE